MKLKKKMLTHKMYLKKEQPKNNTRQKCNFMETKYTENREQMNTN